MPKRSIASMTVEALLDLRDEVSNALSRRADELRASLSRLGGDVADRRRGPRKGASLKGRKVPAKYRDPDTGLTWAGRGARPRWLQAAIKQGKKPEDFLIGASPKKTAKGSRRRKTA